jgi:hypothetical protein
MAIQQWRAADAVLIQRTVQFHEASVKNKKHQMVCTVSSKGLKCGTAYGIKQPTLGAQQ